MVFLQAAFIDRFCGFFLCRKMECLSKFWIIVSIITSFVASPFTSLILCTRKQFLLEYCFCWSVCFSSIETLQDEVLTCNWRFPFISIFFAWSSYFLNLTEINCAESCKSFSCLSSLICHSWVVFAKTKISFICFSTFLKQLKRISTHAESFKLYPKTLPNISLKLSMQLFSSLIFFGSSPLFPSFDWSLISLFVDDL